MARRDRTTGLPRPRVRSQAKQRGRVSLDERQQLRLVWLAGGLVILLIAGLLGWRWYDANFLRPNKTVLTVAEEKFSLSYYTDRLFLAAQAQSGTGANLTILEQTLFTDLENEAIAEIIAREKGITVTDDEITAEIAAQLGVPAGGAGSSFDTLYRQRLRTVRMSDSHYRRSTEAQVWANKLRDALGVEIGNTAELVTVRKVVSANREAADAILTRLKAGEDLGTVAQTESTDLVSRQKDGLDDPAPERLLPDAVRTAVAGKPAGSELIGPIDAGGGAFWVFRVETRTPDGELSETQKAQLSDLALFDAIREKRPQVKIDNNMSSKDYEWANENAGK